MESSTKSADLDQTARRFARSSAVQRTASALLPVVHLPSLGAAPVLARAVGAVATDIDGNEYLDYDLGQGSVLLGHADERVVVAINKAAPKGLSLACPSEPEVRLAELIVSRLPGIQMLRFSASSTEAMLHAVALAARSTGRSRVVACGKCHAPVIDPLVVPYNDSAAAERVFQDHGSSIAAVVVEPIACRHGLAAIDARFLQTLRSICNQNGCVLIFDESLTGFRLEPSDPTGEDTVSPDLSVLGEVLGGGLPLGAFGGRRELMVSAPATAPSMVGLQLAVAAGIVTLQALGESGFHDAVDAQATRLHDGLRRATDAAGVAARHVHLASIVGMFFLNGSAGDGQSDGPFDSALFARFHRAMLDRGVLFPTSPASALFLSAAHTDEQIDRTIAAAEDALRLALDPSA